MRFTRFLLTAALGAACLLPLGAQAAMSDKQFTDLCWNGTAEQVKQALADGANPNAADKGNASRTALMFASAWDKPDPEKVQALLAAGADPNAKDKHGLTVLVYAAEKGNAEVMRLLLAAGAQVNGRTKDGETALMRAAMHRRSEAVKLLLAAGADTSLKDSDGLDALWHARNQADNDEVTRLLEGGAKKPAKKPGASTLVEVRHAPAVEGKTPVTLKATAPLTLTFHELDYEGDGPKPGGVTATVQLAAGETHTFSHEQPFDMPVQGICAQPQQGERKCWFPQDNEADDGGRFIMAPGFALKN